MNRPAVLIVLLLVAGCAAPRPGPRGLGPGGGRAAPAPIFISPAGEPFRSGASSLEAWFSQVDQNQDGRITLAEFTADHQQFFKMLDLNGDGLLNGEEITRYETEIAPEIRPGAFRTPTSPGQAARPSPQGQAPGGRGGGPRGGGPGGGPGGGGRGGGGPRSGSGGGNGGESRAPAQAAIALDGARYGLLDEPEPVRAADTDIDFQVSAAEWTAAAQKRFGQLDQNHDLVLTRDELHWPPGEAPRRGGGRN